LSSINRCIFCGFCVVDCPAARHEQRFRIPRLAALLALGEPIDDLPWACAVCGLCNEICPRGVDFEIELFRIRNQTPEQAPFLKEFVARLLEVGKIYTEIADLREELNLPSTMPTPAAVQQLRNLLTG